MASSDAGPAWNPALDQLDFWRGRALDFWRGRASVSAAIDRSLALRRCLPGQLAARGRGVGVKHGRDPRIAA
jgi:hypothetical protein